MINYMKAELYRTFNRLGFWLYAGCVSGLGLFINIMFKIYNAPVYGIEIYFEAIVNLLIAGVFLVTAFIDMITGEENKNLTIRNVVSFGMNRSKIVLSKIITTTILSLILILIAITVFVGSGFILFGIGTGLKISLSNYFIRFGVATVLWISAISIGTLLLAVIGNSTLAAFFYAGIFLIISPAVQIVMMITKKNLDFIYNNLITTRLKMLSSAAISSHDLRVSLLLGAIYTVIFVALSIIFFNRQEIK